MSPFPSPFPRDDGLYKISRIWAIRCDAIFTVSAEEFIVGWAKDLPRGTSLALVVNLDREAGLPDEAAASVAGIATSWKDMGLVRK